MARLRYSRAEAEAEATRRAEAFVAGRPDRDRFRLLRASPDTSVRPSRPSKHPVAWLVLFAPVPPDGSMIDGGELCVTVDLESGAVGASGF